MVAKQRAASTLQPAQDDVPVPGQFDDEIDGWDVVGRGPAGQLTRLEVPVVLEGDALRAIVTAANREGMDVSEYVQRALQRLAETLPQS